MSTREEALKKTRSPEESLKEQGDLLRQMVEEAVRKVLDGTPPSGGKEISSALTATLQPPFLEPEEKGPVVLSQAEEDSRTWGPGINPVAVALKKINRTGGKGAVLFTSSLSGEGSSTVCTRVSKVLAQICSGNILLLDGNVRHPSIHKFFKTGAEPGLMDILTGKFRWEEAVRKSNRLNYYVLPSGGLVENPLFWLGSERMAELLALLKTEFEFVLLDAPPLLENAETELFLPWMEATVLVIKARRTPRETARRAANRLQGYKNFLGAVLNR